jgi:adenosylcobinamide-GDP ribazoletransferase
MSESASHRDFAGRLIRDVTANLRFFTRLPLSSADTRPPDWPRMAWAAPLAGAIIGAIGGIALIVSNELSLPPLLCAAFAVAALAATTGALHEDGLADVADGFGGGATREAKLAMMRDSRIGAFGAVALVLSLIIRVGAIAALMRQSPGNAFAALVLAGAAARAAALAPLALLPPARSDGAGAGAAGLDGAHLTAATLTVVAIAFVTGLIWLGVVRALFSAVIAGASAWGVCGLARREIGGQTGDVAGAAAQMSEVAALCALLIGGRGA